VNARKVLFFENEDLKIVGFFTEVPICSLFLNYPPVFSTVNIIIAHMDAILFYALFV
jgi:hypothetical protein